MEFAIKDLIIPTLVDSGESISLISPSIFEKIKQTNIKIKYLANPIKVTILSNKTIPFKHGAKFKFQNYNYFLNSKFYVTHEEFDKNYQIILGYDFSKSNKIVMDFENNTLKFNNVEIKLNLSENQIPEVNQNIDAIQNQNLQTIPKEINFNEYNPNSENSIRVFADKKSL